MKKFLALLNPADWLAWLLSANGTARIPALRKLKQKLFEFITVLQAQFRHSVSCRRLGDHELLL